MVEKVVVVVVVVVLVVLVVVVVVVVEESVGDFLESSLPSCLPSPAITRSLILIPDHLAQATPEPGLFLIVGSPLSARKVLFVVVLFDALVGVVVVVVVV